jgi:hypothetical protein
MARFAGVVWAEDGALRWVGRAAGVRSAAATCISDAPSQNWAR